MAGSLLVCQEIQLTQAELSKITGGSSIAPADLIGGGATQSTEEAKQLSASLKSAEQRAAAAFKAEQKAKRLSTAITVGSFMIAATGLYLSWRATTRPK